MSSPNWLIRPFRPADQAAVRRLILDGPINLYRSCGFVEYDRRDGNIYMALDLACNPAQPFA